MNKIYFTKVFKGYSPEEVEAFIIKLNNDFQQKQQEFAAETKRLNNENEELKRRFEETQSENERLTQEKNALEELIKQLTQEKQELLDRIQALQGKMERAAASEPEAVEAPEPAARQCEPPAEDHTEDYKSEEYRRLCEQMGEKLLIADKRAQEIINEAREEANRIIETAVSEANAEVKKLIAEAKQKAETVYRMISEYEKKQTVISAGLEQAHKQIGRAHV